MISISVDFLVPRYFHVLSKALSLLYTHLSGTSYCKVVFRIKVILKVNKERDFPGGPVGKTPPSQCRGPGFDP